uniref:hypothetical protein n=1 Tax=Okeania sp. SIO2F4 TaxID=2607790 RepID=UPI0025CB82A6
LYLKACGIMPYGTVQTSETLVLWYLMRGSFSMHKDSCAKLYNSFLGQHSLSWSAFLWPGNLAWNKPLAPEWDTGSGRSFQGANALRLIARFFRAVEYLSASLSIA